MLACVNFGILDCLDGEKMVRKCRNKREQDEEES